MFQQTTKRTDAEIVQDSLKDPNEFHELYLRYSEKIYRYVRYRTLSREVTEDLVSAIFVKVMENLDKYNQDYAFSTWLYTMARRTMIDYWRTCKTEINFDELIEESPSKSGNYTENIDTNLTIQELFMQLTPSEQVLIKLRFLDGLEYAEIAKLIAKNEGAIRVAIHRMIKKLRKSELYE